MDYPRLYEYRHRHVDQEKRAAVWRPISNYVYEQLGRPEKVLDPAAGLCEFINAIPAKERWAIDFEEHSDSKLDEGVKLVVADALSVELPANHFDGVFISNFLEHLPTQEAISVLLANMYGAMAPGGRIAIMGPNIRYCAHEYWDFADHILALTHRAVEEHLYAAGFEPTRSIPRFLPYSFGGALPASEGLTSLYLKLPLAWRFFGRQFLVFAERPAR